MTVNVVQPFLKFNNRDGLRSCAPAPWTVIEQNERTSIKFDIHLLGRNIREKEIDFSCESLYYLQQFEHISAGGLLLESVHSPAVEGCFIRHRNRLQMKKTNVKQPLLRRTTSHGPRKNPDSPCR